VVFATCWCDSSENGSQIKKPQVIVGFSSRFPDGELEIANLPANDPVDFYPRLEDHTVMKGERR
jgi:hypothetical protein